MNKRALLALVMAILLPMTGFLLVSYYSNRDVQMPHRYFYDSVLVTNKNGKLTYDTVWHSVAKLNFTNQLGQQVTFDDLKGKVVDELEKGYLLNDKVIRYAKVVVGA